MLAFHIYYKVALGEEFVAEEAGLVEIAAGIAAQVEYELIHTLGKKLDNGGDDLLVGGTGELAELDICSAVVHHKGGIHTVERDLAPGDVKDYILSATAYLYVHLGAGRTLHHQHHRVLRGIHAGYHLVVHGDDSVARKQTGLLGRPSRDDTEHYGRVIRHVELYAYALEIALKFRFGFAQFDRRKINRMGVELRERGHDCGIGHLLHVNGIHVVLLNVVEYEAELAPVAIFPVSHSLALLHFLPYKTKQHTDDDAQNGDEYRALLHKISLFSQPLSPPCAAGPRRQSDGTRRDIRRGKSPTV